MPRQEPAKEEKPARGSNRFVDFLKRSSFTDWCVAIFTVVLAVVSTWQGSVLSRQLRDGEEQFALANRPWLSVEVVPDGDLFFVDDRGGKYAALPLKFSIVNFGKSIAKEVQIDVKFLPSAPGTPLATDALRVQQQLCEPVKPQGIGRFEVFPGEKPVEQRLSVSTTRADIDSHAQADLASPTEGAQPRRFVGLYLVGCVTYTSSFEKQLHQTLFGFHLSGPTPLSANGSPLVLSNGMPALGDFEVGVQVPQKQLGGYEELLSMRGAY